MNKDQSQPLSDYQQAALSAMGIPLWQLREGGLAPVQQGDTPVSAEAAETPADAPVVPNSEPVVVQPPSADTPAPVVSEPVAPAPVSVAGKLLLTLDAGQSSLRQDILMALNWDSLPVHDAAGEPAEQFCDAQASWHFSEQVALHDTILMTPVPEALSAANKCELWQLMVQHDAAQSHDPDDTP